MFIYSYKNLNLMELKQNSIIGTSSIRRKNQILKLRPDLIFKDLRGNVDSRMGKVEKGKLDAIVLAKSGLERLGIKKLFFFGLKSYGSRSWSRCNSFGCKRKKFKD